MGREELLQTGMIMLAVVMASTVVMMALLRSAWVEEQTLVSLWLMGLAGIMLAGLWWVVKQAREK